MMITIRFVLLLVLLSLLSLLRLYFCCYCCCCCFCFGCPPGVNHEKKIPPTTAMMKDAKMMRSAHATGPPLQGRSSQWGSWIGRSLIWLFVTADSNASVGMCGASIGLYTGYDRQLYVPSALLNNRPLICIQLTKNTIPCNDFNEKNRCTKLFELIISIVASFIISFKSISLSSLSLLLFFSSLSSFLLFLLLMVSRSLV